MGDREDPGKPNGLMLNGLRPGEAATATEALDAERWAVVEERIKELIARIQPNKPSEDRRLAVANYVSQLITKCFPCQVFTFGSVPLKTYLPDGDIDLSTFSKNLDLKDTWANEVREALESEEKSETAEFRVKEVQYIKAEVKIIKCLVENIVVDISFNQLGGLCTLCFLDEIDHLISQDHLFKRSVILIKAWCYYESRILGAHHGLLSTYALETLVLYIFHVFNNSFAGPLEVLYRFLDFFSKFDWEKFCVSLWGPVPINSLPDTTAEPPRKDGGELLLNQIFLNACNAVYTYLPSGLDNQGQSFGSKYLNVIDPLRTNNNLGRSVSKGNFYRIRSAFAFGAKKLSVLLECPKEDLVAEVDNFFLNTWRRHGTGNRPDAPAAILPPLQLPNPDSNQGLDGYKNQASARKKMDNAVNRPDHQTHYFSADGPISFIDLSSQSVVSGDCIPQSVRTNGPTCSQSQKSFGRHVSYRVADQSARRFSSGENVQTKFLSNLKPSNISDDCTGQGKLQFSRTRSSPELSETSAEIPSRSRRNKLPDMLKNLIIPAEPDVNNRKGFVSDVHVGQNARLDNDSSPGYLSSHQNCRTTIDSNHMPNMFRESTCFSSKGDDSSSASQALEMNQEEQDMINRMASSGINGLVQPLQLPVIYTSQFPVPPHILPSFGYMPKNIVIPANMPMPPWAAQFPQGFVPHLSGYYSSSQLETSTEEITESSNDISSVSELNQEETDHGSWLEQEHVPVGFVPPDRSFQLFNEKKVPSYGGLNFLPTGQLSNNVSFMRDPTGSTGESINMARVGHNETTMHRNTVESDIYSTNRCPDVRFSNASQACSSRNAVVDSFDSPSIKASNLPRDRGRKPSSAVSSASHGSSKSWQRQNDSSVEHVPLVRDDDIGEWIKQSSLSNEIPEPSSDSLSPVSASHHPSGSEPISSDSFFPIPPMIVCSNPRQRLGSSPNSFFYATGPPVPFCIFNCKYPSDSGTNNGMVEQSNGVDANRSNSLFRDSNSSEKSEQSDVSVSTNMIDDVSSEFFEERKPDILCSDFPSHWRNLQFGRSCQDTSVPGPPIYPAPLMVPPMYYQGHYPWEGPGRPFSAPANVVPTVNYPRFVQVMPVQPGSVRHSEVYQRYGDELPSYRGGTGTFLPKSKVPIRERPTGSRNHRPSYGYDRNDHGDRDGSWIATKSRVSGRTRGRGQHDKPSSRLDRLPSSDNRNDISWDPHKNDRLVSDVSNYQNNTTNSTNPGHANMTYGMYPISSMSSDNGHPSGATVPFVMLYPVTPNLGYGSSSEPEFGSVGPMHLSSINEVQSPSNGVLRGTFDPRHESYQQNSACSSPDQPSSPRRSAASRNYRLKDEDFPL